MMRLWLMAPMRIAGVHFLPGKLLVSIKAEKNWNKSPIVTVKMLAQVQRRKKSVVAFTLFLNMKYARKNAKGLKIQISKTNKTITPRIMLIIDFGESFCFSMMLLSFSDLP